MSPEQQLEIKRIVWAYMIEKGIVTEHGWDSWNIYGGNYTCPPKPGEEYGGYRSEKYWKAKLQEQLTTVGVDWDKTQQPKSDTRSQFEGTEADCSRVETLIGDLYFKDGSKLTLGVGHADTRFSDYVRAIQAIMYDKERVRKIFGE